MMKPLRRTAPLVLLAALTLPGARAVAADEAERSGGEGFPGAWALVATKDNVVAKTRKGAWDVLRSGSGGSGLGRGGGFDLPLEVMTDAHRLVVEDDGTKLVVTYPSGRKRTFVTDARDRYLDDGDGPATVTARREGTTVQVTSEWFRGYKLKETWELEASPRRLVVTGKVKGRESMEYVRTFEPAPPAEPTVPAGEPGAALAEGAQPGSTAPGTPNETAPPAVDRLGECTVRPPRRSSPEELSALVRVSQEEAGKVAVASLAPLKPGDVMSSDVESFEGCLVWPFTLRLPARRGVQEIFVDAGDGKVVRSEFVPIGPPPAETPAP